MVTIDKMAEGSKRENRVKKLIYFSLLYMFKFVRFFIILLKYSLNVWIDLKVYGDFIAKCSITSLILLMS